MLRQLILCASLAALVGATPVPTPAPHHHRWHRRHGHPHPTPTVVVFGDRRWDPPGDPPAPGTTTGLPLPPAIAFVVNEGSDVRLMLEYTTPDNIKVQPWTLRCQVHDTPTNSVLYDTGSFAPTSVTTYLTLQGDVNVVVQSGYCAGNTTQGCATDADCGGSPGSCVWIPSETHRFTCQWTWAPPPVPSTAPTPVPGTGTQEVYFQVINMRNIPML